MFINSLKDVVDNLEILKQRELTYYAGDWCCFKIDPDGCGSVDYDIKLNNHLFNVLKDCEYLQKVSHTVSHRSVTQFKFDKSFDNVTAEGLNSFLLEVIQHFHNKRFKSIKEIVHYAREKFDSAWHEYHYDCGSYWDGDRYCNVLLFKQGDLQIGMPYNSCGRYQLLKKNFIFMQLIRMYRRLNNLSWLNKSDCPTIPIPNTHGGRHLLGTEIVERFWKDLSKTYPFSDDELSEVISKKKEMLEEIEKQYATKEIV